MGIECRKPYIVSSEASSLEDLVTSTGSLTHDHFTPEHQFKTGTAPIPTVVFDDVEEIGKVVKVHKEGCPKNKKKNLGPIEHSNSLISVKQPCKVHANQLPISGINLMDLISKAIEKELSSL